METKNIGIRNYSLSFTYTLTQQTLNKTQINKTMRYFINTSIYGIVIYQIESSEDIKFVRNDTKQTDHLRLTKAKGIQHTIQKDRVLKERIDNWFNEKESIVCVSSQLEISEIVATCILENRFID